MVVCNNLLISICCNQRTLRLCIFAIKNCSIRLYYEKKRDIFVEIQEKFVTLQNVKA